MCKALKQERRPINLALPWPFPDATPLLSSSTHLQVVSCQRSSTFEYEEIQIGHWKSKKWRVCRYVFRVYGKRICVNVWLLSPPFNTAPYPQAPWYPWLLSGLVLQYYSQPGVVMKFPPGVVAFQLLSVKQTFSNFVSWNILTTPFFLPRYFAFVNHLEARYSLFAECTPSVC